MVGLVVDVWRKGKKWCCLVVIDVEVIVVYEFGGFLKGLRERVWGFWGIYFYLVKYGFGEC